MKPEFSNRLLIFCLMLLLAASAILHIGTSDSSFWLVWANRAVKYGLAKSSQLNADTYPPLTTILLFLSAKFAGLIGLHVFWGIKIFLFIFLFFSTAIIYFWSNHNIQFTFYCYLSLLLSSLCLTYIDIFFCPPIFLTFYFISKNKIGAAVFSFTVAVFIKYPPLMIAPFLAVYLINVVLKDKKDVEDIIKAFMTTLAIPVLLIAIPICMFFGSEPLKALKHAFEHPVLSALALNFNWIITRLLQIFPNGIFSEEGWHNTASIIRLESEWNFMMLKLVMAAFYVSIFIRFLYTPKNIESLLLFCILGHMSYFFFNHGVHENHLFLSCLLAITLACINSRFIPLAITLSIISSLNLMAFYGVAAAPPIIWPPWYVDICADPTIPICELRHSPKPFIDLRLLLAVFNTGYFFYLWFNLICKNKIPSQICSAK